MDRTSLTATARKLTAAALLITVLTAAKVAQPINPVNVARATATTTERI